MTGATSSVVSEARSTFPPAESRTTLVVGRGARLVGQRSRRRRAAHRDRPDHAAPPAALPPRRRRRGLVRRPLLGAVHLVAAARAGPDVVRDAVGGRRRRGAHDDRVVDPGRDGHDVRRRRRQPAAQPDALPPQPGVPRHRPRRHRPAAGRPGAVGRRVVAPAPRPPGRPTSRRSGRCGCLRAQVCLVYLASGISKLVDPDWFGGLVLWDRVVRYQYVLEPTPLPGWAIDLLTERWLYYVVGPAAVFTELFIGVGLWFGRTRLAAVWVAIVFHVLIEVSASVEVFSYVAIAALAIWVTPSTRDRIVRVGGDAATSRVVIALVRAGDWFGRFDVVRAGAVRAGDHASSTGTGRVHTRARRGEPAAQPAPAHVPGGRAGSSSSTSRHRRHAERDGGRCEDEHPGRLGGRAVGRDRSCVLRLSVLAPEDCPDVPPADARGVRRRRRGVDRAGSGRRRSLRLRVRPGRRPWSRPATTSCATPA